MSLRIRRGTNAQRTGVTFDLGELVWTSDTERLYVGDGITAGGKNVLAQSAGVGLVWNATTQTIDVSGSTLTTSNVSEGSNLYYTPERAQDAAASLFTTGTHTNISFFYDDAANKINATVTLDGVGIANVQADTAPTLGGNLTLNSKVIQGTGTISIAGSITSDTLTAGTTFISDGVFTKDSNANGFEIYTQYQNGVDLNVYRGTRTVPTTTLANDALGQFTIRGYNGSSYSLAGAISAAWESTATIADAYPKATMTLVAGAGGNNAVFATFNSAGVFNAPVQKTTVYSVAGTALPSAATAGMGATAFVSDATVATFGSVYAGGSTNKVPVYSDGTQWRIG